MKKVKLVGHRGYMGAYPENTLVSIRAALDAGAEFVEFDVQMSMDGVLLVIHDDSTGRTAEENESVFECSFEQLKSISVHHPDKFSDKYKPEPIASLKSIMQLVGEYPAAIAMVEIKDESLDHWGLDKVMSALLDALSPWKNQTIIISFSAAAINYVIKYSGYKTGWVLEKFNRDYEIKAQQMLADYMICNYKKIDAPLWPGDWQWMLYDIKSEALVKKWFQAGSNLIETADIGRLINSV